MVNEWTIYGNDGAAKAVVKELELHDEWMAECFITVTVKSAEPIDFAIGDYITYRDEKYSINYDPTIIKKAQRGSYGEGFVCDNIKFAHDAQNKVVTCDFTDIVLNDNNLHYTSLPTFPFFCESVDDLLDRIQACLEELYPGEFVIIGLNSRRNRERGILVGREQAFIDAYKEYVDPAYDSVTEATDDYGKQNVALTVDNITCWDAVTKIHEDFELNFIQRGYVIVAGTSGALTPSTFRYGRGNGLYELERICDSSQQIVTRLRAYGNETNIPNRYYANLNTQCFGTAANVKKGNVSLGSHYTEFDIDLDFLSTYFKSRSVSYAGTSEYPAYIVQVKVDDVTVMGRATRSVSNNKISVYSEWISNTPEDDCDEPDMTKMDAFINAISNGSTVYFVSYINKDAWPTDHKNTSSENLPNNMAVNRLMLPGFPNQSLYDWVKANGGTDTDDETGLATINGFTGYFSKDKHRPYIDSLNRDEYGLRPASIYFDGNGETTDIHPTIEEMMYGGIRIDEIVTADQITDNGVYDTSDPKNFKITLPDLGFDLSEVYKDGASIDMKDGMCGARSFKMASRPKKNASGRWECTVQRAHDDSLDLWFPYNAFQLHSGDHYVLIGIDMPDAYVNAAAEKLFNAAIEALQKNDKPTYTYQPRIDEIWMQRQHDASVGNPHTSIHDTIKAGDIFAFEDDDLGIDGSIIIDVLTIKENGNNGLPTYEVTLRDEKQVSTIQKMIDKAVTSSSNNSGGSGSAGGYTGRQVQDAIENYGSDFYLSKTDDDTASGVILFLKGLWVKAVGLFGFDAEGNLSANEGNFNGRVTTNIIRSNNYTGDGIADTGWRITNANNGHSKLTIDEIYVRMRATFESLEVKRWNVSAGDTINSCAANVINRTEYLDGSGEALGYSDIRVPWLMRGIPFLLSKFSGTAARKMYAAIRKVRVSLTQEQLSQVKTVRCYFLANDGDTEIQNWWRENDLVRCQTMNVVSTNRQTYTGTTAHTGNVMWWRKCIGVSSEPVELEQGKKYHYIDIAYDKAAEDAQSASIYCMLGSDIPAAGDHMVQFGNTVIPGRMNLWIQMVNGGGSYDYDPSSDAPCIKGFKGIYTFDLSKCWYGGNPCKMTLAPGKKYEFYGEDFRVIKEYGTVPVPTNRGLWTSITPERDDFSPHDNVRKCYYYDEVSHNGCVWRCSIADGVHWVDASGNYITDAAYEALSDAQKVTCTRKPNYTTDEPTANSSNWIKLVSRGEDGNGVEYVFIRTDSYSQPYISNSSDTYGGKTYLDDDYLPLSNYGRCTDNPTGVDQNTPYEWVAKREMSAPDSVTGKRSWEKYSGYMALFSRFSMDGDTPIAVYAWNQSKDTAPSISGNSYPPSGWSKTAPNRPGDGYFLWMSSSVQHSNGTRDNWSTPVRISGDTGSAGEDAKEREWIYRLNSSDGYNSKTTNRGKSFQDDDFAPINWNDNPSGVSSYGDSEYASFREYNHSTKSWGDFHSPIVWSHYGERGMDGDGVEYVFARTSTNTAPYVYSNPTHGGKSYTDDEYTPRISGASETYATDDPQGVTSDLPYEWVAMRRKVLSPDGKTRTWPEYTTGSTNGKMALWAKWSEDGNGIVSITCKFAMSSDATSTNETTPPEHVYQNSWTANIPVLTDDYPYLWRQETIKYTNGSSVIKYFLMGSKGDKGATVRGPREWSSSSSIAYNDGSVKESDHIYYIDLVLYNSKYWRCIKAHNASSSRTPGTSSTYWVEATQFDFVATNLILANYGKVNNLWVDKVEMYENGYDGQEGHILFRVKDGNVLAKTGTFENVKVTGEIHATSGSFKGTMTTLDETVNVFSNGNSGTDYYSTKGFEIKPGNNKNNVVTILSKQFGSNVGGEIEITAQNVSTNEYVLGRTIIEPGEVSVHKASGAEVGSMYNSNGSGILSMKDTNGNITAKIDGSTGTISCNSLVGLNAAKPVALPSNIITGSGSKTLPTNVQAGTVVFVKGTDGDITVYGTIMASNSGTTVSYLNIGRGSQIFIYDGTRWIHFNCSE